MQHAFRVGHDGVGHTYCLIASCMPIVARGPYMLGVIEELLIVITVRSLGAELLAFF